MKRRWPITLVLFALACCVAFIWFRPKPELILRAYYICGAQFEPRTSTTTITMSAIGPGVIGSLTGDIPVRPGFRALGPLSGAGSNSGFLAITQDFTLGNFKIYAPNPSIAGTINQLSQDAD